MITLPAAPAAPVPPFWELPEPPPGLLPTTVTAAAEPFPPAKPVP